MNFKYNLRNLRAVKGWTQVQLAEYTGLSKNNISDYEIGRSQPDINGLIALSKVFNISVDELIGNAFANDDIFQFALYDETRDLTTKQKEDILNMIKVMRKAMKG